jgi:hypothetical protein
MTRAAAAARRARQPHDIGPGRPDQDVDPRGVGRPALGVADDPPHRVAGGYGSRAGQLLALLQGDVGHLSGRGIDLVERAVGKRKHHRVYVAAPAHPGGGVGEIDALALIARLRRRAGAGLS